MESNAAQAARDMLSNLMDERRWRVPQVADALGLSVDIVRRWLQGKSRMQLDDMVAVAKLADADLNEVFGLAGRAAANSEGSVEQLVERKVQEALAKMLVSMVGAPSQSNGAAEGISDSSRRALDKAREIPPASRRRKSG